jgi:hypothetical protein
MATYTRRDKNKAAPDCWQAAFLLLGRGLLDLEQLKPLAR